MSNPMIPNKKRQSAVGETNWDTDYIDYEIKQKVVKTGEGDYDFVVVDEVIEHKRSIDASIQAYANEVGVEAMLNRVALTGDESILETLKAGNEGRVDDFTNFPGDLMEYQHRMVSAEEVFNSLDPKLTQGRTFAEFCEGISKEELDAYILSIIKANTTPTSTSEGGNE